MQVRNLNYLNRDLDKVLLITANPDAHDMQPDNAVKVRFTTSLLRAMACNVLLLTKLCLLCDMAWY